MKFFIILPIYLHKCRAGIQNSVHKRNQTNNHQLRAKHKIVFGLGAFQKLRILSLIVV